MVKWGLQCHQNCSFLDILHYFIIEGGTLTLLEIEARCDEHFRVEDCY